jgi:hypothetical protein
MKDSNPLNIPKMEASIKQIQKENPNSPNIMGRGIQGTKDTFAMLDKTAKGGGAAKKPTTAKKK